MVGFSTAVIDAFRLSMLVSCSLDGPLSCSSPVVVFFGRGHPRFRNFHSIVPVDFVRVKCYEIASLTLRVYQRGSRSIDLTSFQCFKKKKKKDTFLHLPQPQVRELTLDENFLTTARIYFWSTTKSKEGAM